MNIDAIMFSDGLKGLQIDKTNKENANQSSRQTQFVANKLVAACSAHVLTSKYPITLQTSTSYIHTIGFVAGLNGFQVAK